jgi:hypothetical protein
VEAAAAPKVLREPMYIMYKVRYSSWVVLAEVEPVPVIM